jgi:hypothetical protein
MYRRFGTIRSDAADFDFTAGPSRRQCQTGDTIMNTDQPRPAILPFDEAAAEAKLAPWWTRLDREPHYPLSCAEVVEILECVEYRVTHDDLIGFINSGAITRVRRVNGKLAWTAANVLETAFALEHRRRWKPYSALHRHKLSLGEHICEVAASRGEKAFIDLGGYDLDYLLGMLVQLGGDASAVSVLVEAVRQKLRDNEGLDDAVSD